MLRAFEPQPPGPPPGEDKIRELYFRGRLFEAEKARKKAGLPLAAFLDELQRGLSLAAFQQRRPGEALSFVFKNELKDVLDVDSALREEFKIGDWHGFLKNVHRFRRHTDFTLEVLESIAQLEGKGQRTDADSWRRKFRTLGV